MLTDSDIHILNFTLANRLANANYSFFPFMYFPNAFCRLHFAFLLITIRNMILRLLRWLKPRFVSVDFVRIKHWPFTFCVHIDSTVLYQFALCLFTMSYGMQPNPFGLTTPLTMPSAYGQPSTTPWLSASQHHGSGA